MQFHLVWVGAVAGGSGPCRLLWSFGLGLVVLAVRVSVIIPCGHVSVSCLWAQGAFCGSPLRWLSYGVLAFPRLFARVAKAVECVAGDLLFVEEGIIANEDDLTCTSVPMYWLCQDMARVVCIKHTQVRGGYELRCNKERRRGFAVLCGCECVANGFVDVVGFDGTHGSLGRESPGIRQISPARESDLVWGALPWAHFSASRTACGPLARRLLA